MQYLTKSLKRVTFFSIFVVLITVIIADYIFYKTGGFDPGRPIETRSMAFELVAGSFAFLIGLKYFRPNFNVALANGISRKTFLLANLPVAALIAVVFPVSNLLMIQIHNVFSPISTMSEMIFPLITGWLWSLLFQFALYFMLLIGGWFITFIYYRSNALLKWIISLIPFVFFIIPIVDSQFYYQSIHPVLKNSIMWVFHQPARPPLLMLIFSAILAAFTFLLIYRAPLKD